MPETEHISFARDLEIMQPITPEEMNKFLTNEATLHGVLADAAQTEVGGGARFSVAADYKIRKGLHVNVGLSYTFKF